MKRIGITQRVERVQSYSERRDSLDQRWPMFVEKLGFLPCPLPNFLPDKAPQVVAALKLDAILLSGGNSIASFDPSAFDAAHERDAFENALLDEALNQGIPVIGVCRGMQMINVYMGGGLAHVAGHVAVRHPILSIDSNYTLPTDINSYHDWCIPLKRLADNLDPIAVDVDGHIEAFTHVEKNLLGIMWHPEREQPFNRLDIKLIKRFLL